MFKFRAKSGNPNAYTDKITDQQFFNRNFRLKQEQAANGSSTSNDIVERNHTSIGLASSYSTQRYLESPNGDSQYYTARINNSELKSNQSSNYTTLASTITNNNNTSNTNQTALNMMSSSTSNSNQLTKLKLLKKRNALKKTLSNANTVQVSTSHIQVSSPTNRSQNFNDNLANSSKEDFRSQNSLNNVTNINNIVSSNRPLSMHLSRTSLNNIENSNLGSNPQLNMHKSSKFEYLFLVCFTVYAEISMIFLNKNIVLSNFVRFLKRIQIYITK